MKKIIDKLETGYMVDLAKPEIDKFERARLIKSYMKKHIISMSEFCRRFNLKKGTVSGWLKWDELGEKKYTELKSQGMTETDITNCLKQENYSKETQLLLLFNKCLEILQKNKIRPNRELIEKTKELRSKIDYLLYKVERDDGA